MSHDADPLTGRVLDGRYEIGGRIARGGMASVYAAHDLRLARDVAVKVLHRHLSEHEEARDRFEREAHAVAKLRHENILEIFAYSGKESPESYIVTERSCGLALTTVSLNQFSSDFSVVTPRLSVMLPCLMRVGSRCT